MKVLILGGGASGMAAALTAALDPENQVTVLERQSRVGRKLPATAAAISPTSIWNTTTFTAAIPPL